MKILMVNKFFYMKGGSETYYFALKEKLEREGHIVIDFSMKDEKNFKSSYSDFFVENVDYFGKVSIANKAKMAANIIYSIEAKGKFENLVKKEKPDMIHLHIFQHQISPSILDICKKYNIPTIYTAHDLKMICLNYKMMHHGKICEDCKDGHLYHCLMNKCVKDSFFKSCINTIEGYLHRWRKSYDVIDYIITPSAFYKKKFEEFGVSTRRVIHLTNILDQKKTNANRRTDNGCYFLYFGRLSEEKGILTLVKAMKGISANLYIVGTGPLKKAIEAYLGESEIHNVMLLGFKSGQDLIDIVGNAKAVVAPSEWYENGPYSAIEAMRLGIPIIGADIGGIPERINGNGCLFEPGNVHDLHKCLEHFLKYSEETYEKMQSASREIFEEQYADDEHYKKLMKIYKKAIVKHGKLAYGSRKTM